jgi:hypothetical protein
MIQVLRFFFVVLQRDAFQHCVLSGHFVKKKLYYRVLKKKNIQITTIYIFMILIIEHKLKTEIYGFL